MSPLQAVANSAAFCNVIQYDREDIFLGKEIRFSVVFQGTSEPDLPQKAFTILPVFGSNKPEYQGRNSPRPKGCQYCGRQDGLIGHGKYPRKAKGTQQAYWMDVKRWLRKECWKTISVLPEFLLPYRHILGQVIHWVLEARFERQLSWAELKAECRKMGLPTLRTIPLRTRKGVQRWCKSFGGIASRWLGVVQETLARQDRPSSWLDPQGEAPRAQTTAEALLAASEHLLDWGKTQWAEMVEYGRNERLRFRKNRRPGIFLVSAVFAASLAI